MIKFPYRHFEERPISVPSFQIRKFGVVQSFFSKCRKALVGALDALFERDDTRLVQVKDDVVAFVLFLGIRVDVLNTIRLQL